MRMPGFHMPVKANAVREGLRFRLADVMEKHAQGQREAGFFQKLQHAHGVNPDVAFGMKFRRLLHALHARSFGQNLGE